MRIKKRNLFLLCTSLVFILFIYVLVQFQPIFKVQARTYFHEKMVVEIMNCIKEIHIPDDFIVKADGISVDTNRLNRWLVEVNECLNDRVEDRYEAKLPIGYFTGITFIQNSGPTMTTSFLISQRIVARYDLKTTTLGINNALIELILRVECKGVVFMGFESTELLMIENIPLALEYVQGEVPQIFPY